MQELGFAEDQERVELAPSAAGFSVSKKKTARGLRQRGSDYRCCIPALAGFVSPQSIAPDGRAISREAGPGAIGFSFDATGSGDFKPPPCVDTGGAIWFDPARETSASFLWARARSQFLHDLVESARSLSAEP
jgi:hypothetical protein